MPAKSVVQRQAAAIAEHHPEELYARNRGMMGMSLTDLKHYASTPEKGLPKRVANRKVAKKKVVRRGKGK